MDNAILARKASIIEMNEKAKEKTRQLQRQYLHQTYKITKIACAKKPELMGSTISENVIKYPQIGVFRKTQPTM